MQTDTNDSIKNQNFELAIENKRLRDELDFIKAKLDQKRIKLKLSRDELDELSEKKAEEILRNQERLNRPIIVHVSEGGIFNLYDSPLASPSHQSNFPESSPTKRQLFQ